jgi:hypothetical protein
VFLISAKRLVHGLQRHGQFTRIARAYMILARIADQVAECSLDLTNVVRRNRR